MPPTTPAPPTTPEELDLLISDPSDAVCEVVRACEGDFVVLGAGGKMGLHLAQMLRRSLQRLGDERRVIAVSRFQNADSTEPFRRHGIDTLSADLSREEDYPSLPEVANVFFLAGVKFGTGSSPELLRQMNVEMPARVAEHYRWSNIVAMSTGCVYSFTTPESGGSRETDATDPPGDYARSCLGREQAFTAGSLRHGTPVVLIRLNYSVEMRYGVLVDIALKVLRGQPIDVGMGYANVIWQGDAISQIIRSLPLTTSPPRILNVTGREVLRVRDLAERFAQRLGMPAKIEGTEGPTAWLSNSSRAAEWFGEPRVDLETLIDWTSDWVSHGRELLGKPTHFENREGKY